MWDRETIEKLPVRERPKIRCRVSEFGNHFDTKGSIHLDGNWPWVACNDRKGNVREGRFSWELVLQVLNDSKVSPIFFE